LLIFHLPPPFSLFFVVFILSFESLLSSFHEQKKEGNVVITSSLGTVSMSYSRALLESRGQIPNSNKIL
jgi:hypothetical protein